MTRINHLSIHQSIVLHVPASELLGNMKHASFVYAFIGCIFFDEAIARGVILKKSRFPFLFSIKKSTRPVGGMAHELSTPAENEKSLLIHSTPA